MTVFADVNGDPADPFAAGKLYLVLDPDPGMQVDRTDYLINTFPLPGTIQFAGPQFGVGGADAVTGFTAVPGAPAGTPPVLVFSRTGAIENPGAFRFGDDGDKNHLEAAVVNLIGKVEVRKYLLAADSPTMTDGFFAEGNEVFDGTKMGKTAWVWYD